jgi:hypothetical protein
MEEFFNREIFHPKILSPNGDQPTAFVIKLRK